jgi:tRNA G18 (ribose-2'-O)-methylase SpoU
MPIVSITNPEDERLSDYRSLSDPALLEARGLFIAEGRIVVRRLLTASRFRAKSLLLTEAARISLADVLAAGAAEVPIYIVPRTWMQPIVGYNIHRGCLAVSERGEASTFEQLLASLAGARVIVGLEGVNNPDNVGGIFRNASAFAASAVVIGPGCADPLYRKTLRVSSGAVLRVPFAAALHWSGALQRLRQEGFTLVALTPARTALPLDRAIAERRAGTRWALLLGAEGSGLTPETQAAADLRVRIPMAADADSLNVAVACGIALGALYVEPS